MCCFSGHVDHVTRTRIFARPDADGRQFLVYQMNYKAKEPVAMVLPLPTPAASPEDALRFIDLHGYEYFFVDLERGFPDPDATAWRGVAPATAAAAPVPLAVVEVGAFVASFVPTRADFTRLDARFRLPDATFDALPRYRDYGFAVFQLRAGEPKVHPMAFSFPRRDPGALFFPTVHIHDGVVHERAGFDHVLYAQAERDTRPALGEWRESERPASAFVDLNHAAGIVAGDAHVHRSVLRGDLINRDTLIALA
ncbi:MAG: hypothetical protein H0X45_08375 [Planctomycetes bacterium]|nr:hypothetical protein [Planctomycetota bacterium]